MLIAILLLYVANSRSEETEEVCPTCIKVNTTCYNVTHLFDIDAPFRNTIVINKLGILRASNVLYYSFEPNIEDEEYFKVGFTNLDSPLNNTVISGGKQIMNFGTFDLDQDNGLVYLGGSDGVYVLDTKLNRVAPYSSRGDTVVSLFFKGHIFFVRHGEFKIVKKKGDNFDVLSFTYDKYPLRVLEYIPVKNFVINKYNVVIFLSSYGLFVNFKNETVWLSKNSYFRGLVIDLDDVVYAWWVDGIYKVIIEPKLSESRIVKIAHIPSMGALTFDNNNNFIFTVGRSLYGLNATTAKVC